MDHYHDYILEQMLEEFSTYQQGVKSAGKSDINHLLQEHVNQKKRQMEGKSIKGYRASITDGGPGWALSEGKFNKDIIDTFEEAMKSMNYEGISSSSKWNWNRISPEAKDKIENEMRRRDRKPVLPKGKQLVTKDTERLLDKYEKLGVTEFRGRMREQGYTYTKAIELEGKHDRGETKVIS